MPLYKHMHVKICSIALANVSPRALHCNSDLSNPQITRYSAVCLIYPGVTYRLANEADGAAYHSCYDLQSAIT
jgi:hypothetical protein